MISFCKKTVHNFLGFSHLQDPPRTQSPCRCWNIPSSSSVGLRLIAGEYLKPANVLQSASVKPSAKEKKDSEVLGLVDGGGGGYGGVIDGLSLCTESLGFESSFQVEEEMEEVLRLRSRSIVRSRRRKKMERVKRKEEIMRFPPPLSSLNKNGHPNFFLKPVRKDGRLEIREVRLNRPEILRSSRQDGRLRLQIIEPDPEPETEPEFDHDEEAEEILPVLVNEEQGETQERIQQWKFPVSSGGESFRRCYDHHYHHQIPLWNHHCVTTT